MPLHCDVILRWGATPERLTARGLAFAGSKATLLGPGYSLGVSKFHKVTAFATAGGRNKKIVHPVDYVFEALGHWS